MLKDYGINHELFVKYEKSARESFDPMFVSLEHVLAIADEAALPQENKQFLADFFDYADTELLQFIWLFYYIQYHTDEDFKHDIWFLDTLPMPKEAEQKFPGGIKAITYLLAVENLKKWVGERNLGYDIVEAYFGRYNYVAELNLITPGTRGLCRLTPFLHGYSKPFSLRLGRLAFQLKSFTDHMDLYENKDGDRIRVATKNCGYDDNGLPLENGGVTPVYEKKGDTLICQTFDKKGRLCKDTITVDLNEYSLALTASDDVVTIHIPEGGKLTMESIKESLVRAREIYSKYFPGFKGFVCRTWFIDPALRGEIIKDTSNMAMFADLFEVHCEQDQDNHSIFEHVFKVARQPLENLVPANDFQKRLVDRALRGEKIYCSYGIMRNDFEF